MKKFLQYLGVMGVLFVVLVGLAYMLYTGFGRYSPPALRLGQPAPVTNGVTNARVAVEVPPTQTDTSAPQAPEAGSAPNPAEPMPDVPVVADVDDMAVVETPSQDVAAVFEALPDQPDPTVELIDRRARKGEWVEAVRLCRELLEDDPDRGDVRLRLAGLYLAQDQVNEAYRQARRVMEKEPENARARLFMGELMFRQELPSLALEYAEKALTLESDLTAAKKLKARALTEEGSYEEARDQLIELIAVMPNDMHILLLLAGAYDKLDESDQARKLLEKGVEMQPSSPVVYLLKGHHHLKKGEVDSAIANYRKVLSLDRGNVVALNNLASLLAEHKGEQEEALQLAAAAWQLSPGAPEIADTLGWLHYKGGDYRRAATLLAMAARKRPQEPQLRYHLAKVLIALERLPQAEAQLRLALQMNKTFESEDEARELLEKIRNNELDAE